MKIGMSGLGAIGSALKKSLAEEGADLSIVSALVLKEGVPSASAALPNAAIVTQWDEFIASGPDVIVECAGHTALRAFGSLALRAGRDLIVSSVGALADRALESDLRAAARHSRSRIVIPAGAAGGLDALGAARRAGLDSVTYISRKQPRAWEGTQAEGMIDLSSVKEARVFFQGNARNAALTFPQNANVVAAIALAGSGFENTQVQLMADPETLGNRHIIDARGSFGEISVSVMARTLPDNPKTSMLAPYSLVRSIVNLSDWIVV